MIRIETPRTTTTGCSSPDGAHVLGWYGYTVLIEPATGEVVEEPTRPGSRSL